MKFGHFLSFFIVCVCVCVYYFVGSSLPVFVFLGGSQFAYFLAGVCVHVFLCSVIEPD